MSCVVLSAVGPSRGGGGGPPRPGRRRFFAEPRGISRKAARPFPEEGHRRKTRLGLHPPGHLLHGRVRRPPVRQGRSRPDQEAGDHRCDCLPLRDTQVHGKTPGRRSIPEPGGVFSAWTEDLSRPGRVADRGRAERARLRTVEPLIETPLPPRTGGGLQSLSFFYDRFYQAITEAGYSSRSERYVRAASGLTSGDASLQADRLCRVLRIYRV